MKDFVSALLAVDFMPHGHCYFWQPDILWLHTFSDGLIGLSYFSIPAALVYFIRRREDLVYHWMFFMFGAFIFACGTTHLMNIVTTWTPAYRLEGLIKLVTALVSLTTAILLWPLVKKALLLPSPSQLAAANNALQGEVIHRKNAEAEVRQLNRELEGRVEARTAELARTNQELQAKAEALVRANADLEQFAYATSHDLKAPLRAIDNLSTWIEEDLGDQLQGSSRKQMQLLRGRIDRMECLLDGLLEYSRVGRMEVEIEHLDCGALLTEIIELLGPPPGFTIRATTPMPTFETARAPLQQVLMNLIANSIKHHDRQEGTVEIAVEDRREVYIFVISDDGPGIPDAFQEKVFAIFQTLKPRDELEAAGMGLAIVKKVVTEARGRITLDPFAGRGTVIRFSWPKRWR